MQVLIIEQDEQLRLDIKMRIEEASRSTGLRGFIIEAIDMKNLGGSTPDLIVLGAFAKETILEIHSRLNSIYPNTPVLLLLSSTDYLEDAVELYKRTMIRVVALGDLPQISQILINLSRPLDHSLEYKGNARVISFVSVKGGVGTTTSAASLASFYDQFGISSLLIDLNYANRDLTTFSDYSYEQQSALSLAFKSPQPDMRVLKPTIGSFRNSLNSHASIIGAPQTFLESFQLFTNGLPVNSLNPSWLETAISCLAEDNEVLILDLGNHWGVSALAALALSTHVCLTVDEDDWCVNRSFSMLAKMSQESEDPGEFDFRKWRVIVNGVRGSTSLNALIEKYNKDPHLIPNPSILSIPWNKKCVDWFTNSETAYELADSSYREAIENLGRSIRPF